MKLMLSMELKLMDNIVTSAQFSQTIHCPTSFATRKIFTKTLTKGINT